MQQHPTTPGPKRMHGNVRLKLEQHTRPIHLPQTKTQRLARGVVHHAQRAGQPCVCPRRPPIPRRTLSGRVHAHYSGGEQGGGGRQDLPHAELLGLNHRHRSRVRNGGVGERRRRVRRAHRTVLPLHSRHAWPFVRSTTRGGSCEIKERTAQCRNDLQVVEIGARRVPRTSPAAVLPPSWAHPTRPCLSRRPTTERRNALETVSVLCRVRSLA